MRPWVIDACLAVAMTLIAWLVAHQYEPDGLGSDLRGYALILLIYLPLAARRTLPVTMLALSCAALVTFAAVGYTQLAFNFWAPVLSMYSVASQRSPKVTAVALTASVPLLIYCASHTPGVTMPVELLIAGEVNALPAGLQFCVYRVAQEALTNVIKHADRSQVSVLLYRETLALTMRIVNEIGEAGEGSGHGLINMRERAAVYGGTLTAGPQPEGGFKVELVLPLKSAPS